MFAFSNWFLLYLHFLRFLIFWAIGRGWWGPQTAGALSFWTNPTQWALRQYLYERSSFERTWFVHHLGNSRDTQRTLFIQNSKFNFRQKRSLHDRCHEGGSANWPPCSKRLRQGGRTWTGMRGFQSNTIKKHDINNKTYGWTQSSSII
jgi:hypothetical protein